MDEATWVACADPQPMLDFLRGRGKLSERKARLFGAACCRRLWHLLDDQRSRGAVETAEQYAEGVVPASAIEEAQRAAWDVHWKQDEESGSEAAVVFASEAAAWAVWWEPCEAWRRPEDDRRNAGQAAWAGAEAMAGQAVATASPGLPWQEIQALEAATRRQEKRTQADMLRDIFGHPFRSLVLDPAWRTPDMHALAQAAYDTRTLPAGHLDPARLAVLADALEEVGCTDPDILSHCRGPGPHARGCFVVDALLGRE